MILRMGLGFWLLAILVSLLIVEADRALHSPAERVRVVARPALPERFGPGHLLELTGAWTPSRTEYFRTKGGAYVTCVWFVRQKAALQACYDDTSPPVPRGVPRLPEA